MGVGMLIWIGFPQILSRFVFLQLSRAKDASHGLFSIVTLMSLGIIRQYSLQNRRKKDTERNKIEL